MLAAARMRKAGNVHRDWIIAPPHPQREALALERGVSPLLAQLFLSRGVVSDVEIERFLAPEFKLLLPPAALPGAVRAAELIVGAISARRKIVVYGDYDVDGITATTILYHVLKLAGADVDFYIPSRLEEGYGLNAEALSALAQGGAGLVISVDCGITAVEPVERARACGLQVIITDHHQPQAVLPEADVIVHPTALGASENPHLSGAGVALKVAWAVAQRLGGSERVPPAFRECLIEATVFAALGLIADIVPMIGENRVIAAFGLGRLMKTSNDGLRALIEVAGCAERKRVDDYDVGFLLAPRLNAIGRLGHARLAVELFTRAQGDAAREIAQSLDAHNRKRQEVERTIAREAEEMTVARGFDRESCRGIVLASAAWHPGVVGIVASRLVDRFFRPTVLIALDGEFGQGSGRSIRHFPLHEVLGCCAAHLTSHGGHAMAAGVRLRGDCVDAFTEAFLAQAASRLTPADLQPKLRLDDEVALADLTPEVVETVERFAPFGEGNPRPKLASLPVELVEPPRIVGKSGTHLQFTVREGRTYRKAIAFNRAADCEALAQERQVQLAFEPIMNEWNGRRSVELKVVDWRRATV